MFRQRRQNWLDSPVLGWIVLVFIITVLSGGSAIKKAHDETRGKITIAIVVAIMVGLAFWLR